jgi:hypothetical protein
MSKAFAASGAGNLRAERFTIGDIGCSGGIDPVRRISGGRPRRLAFDASVGECEQLADSEASSRFHSLAGSAPGVVFEAGDSRSYPATDE